MSIAIFKKINSSNYHLDLQFFKLKNKSDFYEAYCFDMIFSHIYIFWYYLDNAIYPEPNFFASISFHNKLLYSNKDSKYVRINTDRSKAANLHRKDEFYD